MTCDVCGGASFVFDEWTVEPCPKCQPKKEKSLEELRLDAAKIALDHVYAALGGINANSKSKL